MGLLSLNATRYELKPDFTSIPFFVNCSLETTTSRGYFYLGKDRFVVKVHCIGVYNTVIQDECDRFICIWSYQPHRGTIHQLKAER